MPSLPYPIVLSGIQRLDKSLREVSGKQDSIQMLCRVDVPMMLDPLLRKGMRGIGSSGNTFW